MILRSITQHVEEQNWFAVPIDFERPITESKPVIFRAIELEITDVAKTQFDYLDALSDVDREILQNDPDILEQLKTEQKRAK